jgi:hypothetical protein
MTNQYPADGPQQPNPWVPAPEQFGAQGQPAQGQPMPGQPMQGQPMPPAPQGQTPYGYGYPAYPYPVARKTNGLAIASLVVSIASFFVCAGLIGFVGAILGHVARKQIAERGEDGAGMAKAGIIIGWIATAIGLVLTAVYVVFIVFAISHADNTSTGY